MRHRHVRRALPGLNSVIRAIVLSLHHNYGVRTVYGFPYGYEGLTHRYGHQPVELTPAFVDRIHEQGGTILGSSRGNQDIGEMVDTLEQMNIGILFTIGGDGPCAERVPSLRRSNAGD